MEQDDADYDNVETGEKTNDTKAVQCAMITGDSFQNYESNPIPPKETALEGGEMRYQQIQHLISH